MEGRKKGREEERGGWKEGGDRQKKGKTNQKAKTTREERPEGCRTQRLKTLESDA